MILLKDQVKEIALSEVDSWIKTAREDHDKLILHYYGVGTDEHLTKISGLENEDQLKLRKDHAISNEFVVENLLRPIDNIWNAKGYSEKIELPDNKQKELKERLKDVGKGLSLREYIKEMWKDALFTDPNGLTFVEISKDGKKSYITHKNIYNIKNMKVNGIRPEYVCLEPHEIEVDDKGKATKTVLWVIDNLKYYEVEIKQDVARILKEVNNIFGKVPAILNSPIIDSYRKINISPIHKQVKLLDSYLINHSVKEIYQFLHGYPVFWQYAQKCKTCNGIGTIEGDKCSVCGGTGWNRKKDVSNAITLRPPTEEGQPVIAPDVAGYVQPDLETWREQRTELDWKFSLIYYSHWGTTTERTENETATGRFIDVQPVNNRLNLYADFAETIHHELLDMIAKFYFTNSYKGSSVHYGRRFLIETPDQVWEKYLKAKEKKAPISALNQLLEQYYESEYQTNKMLQDYYLKLIKIEPFVHSTVDQVVKMNIPEIDKVMKIYFSDWLQTMMINEIIDQKIEKLQNELREYCKPKIETNGRTNNSQEGDKKNNSQEGGAI